MKSAQERVQEMIKKKKMKNKRHRIKAAKVKGPEQIIKEFLSEYDMNSRNFENHTSFVLWYESVAEQLQKQISLIDKESRIEVVIANKEGTEAWDNIIINGVRIFWSDEYKAKNKLQDDTYIDMGHLFMDGLFD